MAKKKEDDGSMDLVPQDGQESTELAPTREAAAVAAEIQGALVVAKRFPRNEDASLQRIMRSCKRPRFAELATYSFPRGGTTVSGPSVYLAREAARSWGNVRSGFKVTRDDEESRQVVGWAWDLETNVYMDSTSDFKKRIQRKRGGQTVWIAPDERDLRELTNKHAAICMRNALLSILPADIVDEAVETAQATVVSGIAEDPDAVRKKIIANFLMLNVTVGQLEAFLGHSLAATSPAELQELRGLFQGIKEGQISPADIFAVDQADEAQKRRDAIREKLEANKTNGGGEEPTQEAEPQTQERKEEPTTEPQAETENGNGALRDEPPPPLAPRTEDPSPPPATKTRLELRREFGARCTDQSLDVKRMNVIVCQLMDVDSANSLTAEHYGKALDDFDTLAGFYYQDEKKE